ncbi:Uma2 family endonuclease [Oscillatoria sp. CS-180]|uniref:Uma2 family endonuclease n=1 Tax=Oscillatoria sp. CS-180 TaxID=3021720 RepID=UPI00232EAB82|nr:Uma2 family endonuclease [Oscillatoria sp. CS-180]MDB9528397.1 Uma2 family endonuclease [Oscillatoria sp. CS-180]
MVLTAQELADLMPDATQLESNEPEMESSLHYAQLALLVTCLEWLWRDQGDFFIGANLTIYFSREQLKNRDYRGPDFFLVKNTEKHPRKSWVVWEEGGQYPDLIVELLSDSIARTDKNLKKELYQNRFRTPEYFWFSPENLQFEGFRLENRRYESIDANSDGLLWSDVLGLYLGIHDGKLRYFHETGELVLTPEEDAVRSQQQAKAAEARATRLAEQLRAMGIDPND